MGATSQLALHVFSSLAMLMYLFWVQPMETPLLNFTEIYNELTFLFCIYFTFLFTDYTEDASQKETYGWGFIALVLLNITVNLLIVVYLMIRWLCDTVSLMFKRYVNRIVIAKY